MASKLTTEPKAESTTGSTSERAGEPGEHEIIVVSGLPRSGTSLVMQILEAAGVPLLTDGIRSPDESNPRGYFELEAVKRIRDDVSFLNGAEGKAFKIVSPLLPFLPAEYDFALILVERDIREVLNSQRSMLRRTRTAQSPLGHREPIDSAGSREIQDGDEREALERSFRTQLERARRWGDRYRKVRVHVVSHAELIAKTEASVRRIFGFLGLDPEDELIRGSAAVVDASLYRERDS